jgi:phage terminase large subunit-like protein
VNLTAEERRYAETHGLDAEQMAWRRAKIMVLHGEHHFRREYPATPDEAFSAESPGALWRRERDPETEHPGINTTRVRPHQVPELLVSAIAIDPSTTSKNTSDECGMIWGGRAANGHAYVLGDETVKASPETWATNAVHVYTEQQLNAIVNEANQGGDMVATIIHLIDDSVNVENVWASKGKRARAEPVATLYKQGRVHHVGELPALEDELCTWDALTSNESPNRLDALVWLITYLLIDGASRIVAASTEGLAMGDRGP